MATIKYAVLEHHMNYLGNRVSKILIVRDSDYIIFNLQCYEHEIRSHIQWKLKMKKRDKLIELTKTKIQQV